MPCISSADSSPPPSSLLPCSALLEPASAQEARARLTASRSASSPRLVYLFKRNSFPRVELTVLSSKSGLQPEHLENGERGSPRRMKNRWAEASIEDEGRDNPAPHPGALQQQPE